MLLHLSGASFLRASTNVFLSDKAETAVETRQVFRRAGTRHSGWFFFVGIPAAKRNRRTKL